MSSTWASGDSSPRKGGFGFPVGPLAVRDLHALQAPIASRPMTNPKATIRFFNGVTLPGLKLLVSVAWYSGQYSTHCMDVNKGSVFEVKLVNVPVYEVGESRRLQVADVVPGCNEIVWR